MIRKNISVVICLALLASGCATVSGPAVSQGEIEEAREALRAKALSYQLKQLERVSNIGYKLVLSLPSDNVKKNYPYVGFIVASIDKYTKRLLNLDKDKGLVVVAVINNSPAQRYDVRVGDIIKSVNGKTFVKNISGFFNYIEKMPSDKVLNFKIERQGNGIEVQLMPQPIPLNVHFQMVDMPEVNAAATANNYILYTYGMVKFTQSDDEIAVVLGHELAHLVRGHLSKIQGAELLNVLLALALGIVVEYQSPGSGSAVMRSSQDVGRIFSTKYSRDLENEADYFGMQYVYNAGYNLESGVNVWERFAIELPQSMVSNFLDTHPSSPERMVRIQKIIKELKTKNSQIVPK